MKSFTRYRRLPADTINGEAIEIATVYSSNNKEEIDEIEKYLRKNIKDGIESVYDAGLKKDVPSAKKSAQIKCKNCIYFSLSEESPKCLNPYGVKHPENPECSCEYGIRQGKL